MPNINLCDSIQNRNRDFQLTWVNSFKLEQCIFVTSLDDFNNGKLFCELLTEILNQSHTNSFISLARNRPDNYTSNKENLISFQNELQRQNPPRFIIEYPPNFIMESDEAKLTILEFLYYLSCYSDEFSDNKVAERDILAPLRVTHSLTNSDIITNPINVINNNQQEKKTDDVQKQKISNVNRNSSSYKDRIDIYNQHSSQQPFGKPVSIFQLCFQTKCQNCKACGAIRTILIEMTKKNKFFFYQFYSTF